MAAETYAGMLLQLMRGEERVRHSPTSFPRIPLRSVHTGTENHEHESGDEKVGSSMLLVFIMDNVFTESFGGPIPHGTKLGNSLFKTRAIKRKAEDPLEYPTPSPSPSTSCPASPPSHHIRNDPFADLVPVSSIKMRVSLERAQKKASRAINRRWTGVWGNTYSQQSDGSFVDFFNAPEATTSPEINYSRRKTLNPQRALHSAKEVTEDLCSINLDVFSLYHIRPANLLYSPPKLRRNNSSDYSIGSAFGTDIVETVPAVISPPIEPPVVVERPVHPKELKCTVPSPSTSRTSVKSPPSMDGFVKGGVPSFGECLVVNAGWHKTYADFRIANEDYLDTENAPTVSWKGAVLDIPTTAFSYSKLTTEEIKTCRILRIYPDQYLHIKRALVSAVVVVGPYKKRDAQGWFRMDVNKVNKLYDWFKAIGWIPMTPEDWPEAVEEMLRKEALREVTAQQGTTDHDDDQDDGERRPSIRTAKCPITC
ncbi:hypothetical protein BJ742DRAFT_766530 [Cladochytrium replicatum]|nr:hypothetical protein BJ742DRAFT_766530 [Cladochytrium replicatum]